MIISRSIVLLQMVLFVLVAECIPLCICITSLLIPLLTDVQVVSMSRLF